MGRLFLIDSGIKKAHSTEYAFIPYVMQTFLQ